MSRINKTQKYAILWLNYQNRDVSSISKELNLTEEQIHRVIKPVMKNNIPTASSVVSKSVNSKNLMITESQAGKYKVSIMTKAASEVNDNEKKKNIPKDNSSYIYKPHD